MHPDCLASAGSTPLDAVLVTAAVLLLAGIVAVAIARRRGGRAGLALAALLIGGLALSQIPAPSFAASDGCAPSTSQTAAPQQTPVVVTPVAPTLVSAECGIAPVVELATTEGVVYTTTTAERSTTVTAAAADGFVLADGAPVMWTFTADPCPEPVTPPAPTLVDAPCAQPPVISITEVDGVEFTSSTVYDAGTGLFTTTVTATAEAGFVIPDGVPASWSFVSTLCTGGGGGQSGGGCEGPEWGG